MFSAARQSSRSRAQKTGRFYGATEAWELRKLRAAASPEVWRMITIGLQTGLRETKILESHREWLVEQGDGPWLVSAPGRSKFKGVPKAIPLNRLAVEAFKGNVPRIGGRFFEQWKDANSFKHRWDTTCKRAGVHDVHYHDVRHTFATWLRCRPESSTSSSRSCSGIGCPGPVSSTCTIGTAGSGRLTRGWRPSPRPS